MSTWLEGAGCDLAWLSLSFQATWLLGVAGRRLPPASLRASEQGGLLGLATALLAELRAAGVLGASGRKPLEGITPAQVPP